MKKKKTATIDKKAKKVKKKQQVPQEESKEPVIEQADTDQIEEENDEDLLRLVSQQQQKEDKKKAAKAQERERERLIAKQAQLRKAQEKHEAEIERRLQDDRKAREAKKLAEEYEREQQRKIRLQVRKEKSLKEQPEEQRNKEKIEKKTVRECAMREAKVTMQQKTTTKQENNVKTEQREDEMLWQFNLCPVDKTTMLIDDSKEDTAVQQGTRLAALRKNTTCKSVLDMLDVPSFTSKITHYPGFESNLPGASYQNARERWQKEVCHGEELLAVQLPHTVAQKPETSFESTGNIEQSPLAKIQRYKLDETGGIWLVTYRAMTSEEQAFHLPKLDKGLEAYTPVHYEGPFRNEAGKLVRTAPVFIP